MTTPRTENLSGRPTLGRYAILREVARSNDIVYEAVDPTINRRIALKELNIAPTLTGQARRERIERFFREGRAAGAMNHPNIVTIFEIGEDNGRFFIAMEFLEGQSLRDRLHTVGPMPLSEAVGVTAALCDALAYAHERGVIHRDIKPDNVHILPGGQVKLTDFGIARILGEDQLTVAGQVFGTPSYMSPEQVTGNPLDARTDQFSLGVLLYEMLTGRKPFTGDTVVTITYRIIHEPVPTPPGVPVDVAQVLERSLSKAPQSRFANVADFKQALLQAADRAKTGGYGAQTYTQPGGRVPSGMPAYSGIPAALSADPLAPPLPPGIGATGGQPTMAYGQRTQMNPMGNAPVVPTGPSGGYGPPATTGGNPYATGDSYTQKPRPSNIGTIVIASVVLLGVVGGAGFALKTAFQNMSQGQSREKIAKVYAEGAALYEKKEYEEAAADFKKVRDAGDFGDARMRSEAANGETYCYRMLGQRAQDAKDLATAEMYFTRALEVSPLDSQAQTELAAVRKLRGTDTAGGPAQTMTGPNGEKVDLTNNPLASVLKPSPDPAAQSGGTPPVALASPSPNGVLPGSQTTNDFTAKNQKAAMDAQALLDRADNAFQQGQRDEAVSLWRQAVATGPGSQAGIKAQDRLNRFASNDPLGGI